MKEKSHKVWLVLAGQILSKILLPIVSPIAICAEEVHLLPLSDPAKVREIEFRAPGCGIHWLHGRHEIEKIVAYLIHRNSDWKRDVTPQYADFAVSFDMDEKNPLVVRAGTLENGAFLQTAGIHGSVYVREITISDLRALLELCGCDPSVALLRPENGYYRKVIERVLTQHTSISARGLDKAATRKLLDSILDYSRHNLHDTQTSAVLRTLFTITVTDFVHGWYAVELTGSGGHSFANLLTCETGKAMPATPKNCLQVCRGIFLRQLWDIDSVKALSAKVLEGSHHGVIVSQNKDIPGYEKKPLPDAKSRVVMPISSQRLDGRTVYKFFSYERIGGIVWQCKLTIEDKTLSLSWEMEQVAKDIGDAMYIL